MNNLIRDNFNFVLNYFYLKTSMFCSYSLELAETSLSSSRMYMTPEESSKEYDRSLCFSLLSTSSLALYPC